MHINKFIHYLILALAGFSFSCNSKNAVSQPPVQKKQLRVLGYLPGSTDWNSAFNDIELETITDLNLAFINPDAAGLFPVNDVFRPIVQKAHEKNVRVFYSIGGGSPPPHLESLIKADKRTALIKAIVDFALLYNFDGIDVDLENSLINEDYPAFIHELSKAIKPTNKLMTAALASWNSNLLHDSTINRFDFINIMSYDKTGPWNINRPGPHSPFSMVEADFNYYHNTRSIPAEKLFIGLPFYGYGFGNGAPESMTYKNIIATYPGSELLDSVKLQPGGTIYYNGIPTIKQKVSFAAGNQAGGVMIWQLRGDSKDERSLLKAISEINKP